MRVQTLEIGRALIYEASPEHAGSLLKHLSRSKISTGLAIEASLNLHTKHKFKTT